MLELIFDQDGRYLDATDELVELLGYERTELRQARVADLLAVGPEPVETFWQTFVNAGRWAAEERHVSLRRKDGSLVATVLRGLEPGPGPGTWIARAAPRVNEEEPMDASQLPAILAEWRALSRRLTELDESDPQRRSIQARIEDVRSRYQSAARRRADAGRERSLLSS
jgi:PAS domain-containing protein